MILAALLFASSSISPVAVQPPPVRHSFNRFDYVLYAGVVSYRVADYFTTENILSRGGNEVELPGFLVKSKPAFAAYSLGMAALEISSSVYLHRHGHAKLARLVDSLSVASGSATDIHNLVECAK